VNLVEPRFRDRLHKLFSKTVVVIHPAFTDVEVGTGVLGFPNYNPLAVVPKGYLDVWIVRYLLDVPLLVVRFTVWRLGSAAATNDDASVTANLHDGTWALI
jgi:hypothetical protein